MAKAKKISARIEIRDWKGIPRFYVIYGPRDTLHRTDYGPHQRAAAEQEKKKIEELLNAPMPSIAAISLETVVKWRMPQLDARERSALKILSEVLGPIRVGVIDQAFVDNLIANPWISPSRGTQVLESTAKQQLAVLTQAIESFGAEHGLADVVRYVISGRTPNQNEITISRSDLIRLMWACLGWRWASEAKGCVRITPYSRYKKVRGQRRSLLRHIIILVGSGSFPSCSRRLRWKRARHTQTSYVDLVLGKLYRLGEDAPGERLQVAVPIGPFLLLHLKRWVRLSPQSEKTIVRFRREGEDHRLFREACRDAGLVGVTLETLTRSFAALGLANGSTIRSMSIATGISGESLQQRAGEYAASFQEGIESAFFRRPRSIA